MATMDDVERALTSLLMAGKSLGSVRESDERSKLSAEAVAQSAHVAALHAIQRYALRCYEMGLDLGRKSAISGEQP